MIYLRTRFCIRTMQFHPMLCLCDIFCIQETWFAVQDLHVVNSLHSKFHGGMV